MMMMTQSEVSQWKKDTGEGGVRVKRAHIEMQNLARRGSLEELSE